MVKVTFIETDGKTHDVDIEEGTSVMYGAINNSIDGIIGECGGGAMCATCHVYVEEEFLSRFPEKQMAEADMLECAVAEIKPNSRLGCQLLLSEEHDGLKIYLPETQI